MSYAYWEQSGTRQEAPVEAPLPPPESESGGTPAKSGGRQPNRRLEPVQVFAGALGAVFVLVGLLGFVPGITQRFGDFALFGRDSGSELLGLFQVSALHNVVHLLFGVGLLAAAKPASAQLYLIVGGLAYGAVGLYGSIIDRATAANFLPFNSADNALHFALAAGMILLGIVGGALMRRNAAASANA